MLIHTSSVSNATRASMSAAWNARVNRSTSVCSSGDFGSGATFRVPETGARWRNVARARFNALLTDSSVALTICATSSNGSQALLAECGRPAAGRQQLQRGDERERDCLGCLIVRLRPRRSIGDTIDERIRIRFYPEHLAETSRLRTF